jgi:hypothetical protein
MKFRQLGGKQCFLYALNPTGDEHLSGFRVVEEVGPVGVGLHVAEDEELAQQQLQDDEGDVVARFLVLNFGALIKNGFF